MVHFERPFIRVLWNETAHCVEVEWRGFAFGKAYREALDALLELHSQKRCAVLLSDMRSAAMIDAEDAKWILEDWLPRAAVAGLCRAAVIVPSSVVGQIQIDQILKKIGFTLMPELAMEIKLFIEPDEARRWALSR